MDNKKLLKHLTNRGSFYKVIISLVLLIITIVNFTNLIKANYHSYTRPFYPGFYQTYKTLYGESQYVRTSPLHIIPDEFLYAYAAWEYTDGVNPILLQGETAPLGKYFIGVSERIFNNEKIIAPIFNVLCLIALFILSDLITKSVPWSLFLICFFSFEKLFIVQMLYSPLLDNIQLFFILISFIFFILWIQTNRFLIPALLLLGAVMSIKLWTTGVIIFAIWLIYTIIIKQFKKILQLISLSFVPLITMLIVFIPSFIHGDNLRRFFGVQKYLFEFHKSKLEFNPLALWDLLLFNRWHVSWKNVIEPSVDWQWTWPIITILSIGLILVLLQSKKFMRELKKPIGLIIIWFLGYALLLSMGSLIARYILPVLPVMYILAVYLVIILSKNIIVYLKKI